MKLKLMMGLLCLLVLFACTSNSTNSISSEESENKEVNSNTKKIHENREKSGFIGYVVKKENDQVLVISPEVQDFSATGGINNYYAASWYKNVPSHIEIGQKVEVWVENAAATTTQYPGNQKAVDIEVIQRLQPEGAILSEAEAIRKALSSSKVIDSDFNNPVIKEVNYDKTHSRWSVFITQTFEERILEVIIEDK